MILRTFEIISNTNLYFTKELLQEQYCGLFRCPLPKAKEILPDLRSLFDSAPVDNQEDWELDLKIHMLMKGQYPCIPNWHGDNIPRIDGETDYSLCTETTTPLMLLWLSDNPTTEFLAEDTVAPNTINSHADLADYITTTNLPTIRVPSNTWISMSQLTPHRGTKAEHDVWRVFARLTHKSIAPIRQQQDYIRRHCQVYLDAHEFTW